MSSEAPSRITTKQEILRFYQLRDGRTMALQHARAHHPVEICVKDQQLYAGVLQIVLRKLEFVRAAISTKGIATLIDLITYIDQQGAYFPGIYLYDCLNSKKGQHLMPLFSSDTMIVFLGSKVTCVSSTQAPIQREKEQPEQRNKITKPGFASKVTNWLLGRDVETKNLLSLPITVPSTNSEVGYPAFRRDTVSGLTYPWFISQTDLINALLQEDDSILVVFAREPV